MRRNPLAGSAPLPPQRKWRAITIATLLLAPAMWSLLIGLVARASDDANAPTAAPLVALGLCLIPFVYIALAWLSEHPRPSSAVAKAMGLCLVIGIPASALAQDAITGLVAGIGAGGSSRSGPTSSTRGRREPSPWSPPRPTRSSSSGSPPSCSC